MEEQQVIVPSDIVTAQVNREFYQGKMSSAEKQLSAWFDQLPEDAGPMEKSIIFFNPLHVVPVEQLYNTFQKIERKPKIRGWTFCLDSEWKRNKH
ncbi:hypothetical protein CEXT_93311 [Caerostris extrusa]|uniref:Uncharacterized protein n=1 Tax=Caerostris extrusa TaxID=172846 RepID=A0AAV4NAI7_CAEEX|nr:hypothetical protein CEXT_93311 [Caerostris extrusa]